MPRKALYNQSRSGSVTVLFLDNSDQKPDGIDKCWMKHFSNLLNSFDPTALDQITQQSLQSELDLSSFVVEVKRAILQTNSDRISAKNAISTDVYKATLEVFHSIPQSIWEEERIFTMK